MRRALTFALATIALGAMACGPEHGTGTRTPVGSPSASASADAVLPIDTVKPVDPAVVPTVSGEDLKNGVRLVSVARAGAALAEIRVVVRVGSADDGDHAGTARVVARAMQAAYGARAANDGRAAPQIDAIVRPNATTFSFRSAPDGVGPTLKAIAAAFGKTSLDAAETKAAATRLTEDLKAERANAAEIGPRLVQRDLFIAPIGRHPYSVLLLSGEDVAGVDAKSASAFLSSFYVASNVSVVAVSPLASDALRATAEEALSSLRTGDARAADVDAPEGRPRPMKVMLIDAPAQDPVEVTWGKFGPTAAQATDTKTRLFGATVVDRLARAGVPNVRFEVSPFRGAPLIALVRAELPQASAADAIAKLHGLLTTFDTPNASELVAARNIVTGEIQRAIDPPRALADTLALDVAVDAPENALERRTIELPATEAVDVGLTGNAIVGHDGILVVVGDAKVLAPALTKFGEVDVLDPATLTRVRSVGP